MQAGEIVWHPKTFDHRISYANPKLRKHYGIRILTGIPAIDSRLLEHWLSQRGETAKEVKRVAATFEPGSSGFTFQYFRGITSYGEEVQAVAAYEWLKPGVRCEADVVASSL